MLAAATTSLYSLSGKPATAEQARDRNWLRSTTNISDTINSGDPALLTIGRTVVVAIIASVIELGMQKRYNYNSFNTVPSEEYDNLMEKAFKIGEDETLLTVR